MTLAYQANLGTSKAAGSIPARLLGGVALSEGFPQEELDLPGRIPVERAEDLVAEPLVEWPRLEAVGLERRSDGPARARIDLGVIREAVPRALPRARIRRPTNT